MEFNNLVFFLFSTIVLIAGSLLCLFDGDDISYVHEYDTGGIIV